MKRDYATTFLAEALVVGSYLLAFRLVASALGTTGFGEYALARRTLAMLVPLGALSMDVAVARFVAYAVSERSDRVRGYVPASTALVLGAAAIVGSVLLLFASPLAYLFFGSASYSRLVAPMALLVLGGGLHGIAYGFHRGSSKIQRANLLMAINQAIVPILAIAVAGGSVETILLAMGAGWTLVSLAFLATLRMSFDGLRPRITELARYGVPRVPGELLRLGLFALPSILIAHAADITVAGSVAFGVAAVGMLGTALAPVGFVMLPAAARMLAQGSIEQLRQQVLRIAWLTAAALAVAIVVVELFAPQIVTTYLGPRFAGTADSIRVIVPAALPWGIYMSLGSVIDAYHVHPVNARNMAIAFAVFVLSAGVLTLISVPALAIAGTFVVSLYVLGALTLWEVHTITRPTTLPRAIEPKVGPLL